MDKPKRYLETYRGIVVSTEDPKQLMRVQVRVFDVLEGIPDRDMPWATYQLPLGSRPNDGMLCPAREGDLVWVRFTAGDTREPVITGSCAHMPDGKPNLAHDQWAGPDKFTHKREDDEPPVPDPPYHKDVVLKQHNALVQFTENGALRLTQLTSGTAFEITPEGTVVIHCEKEILMSAPDMIRLTCGSSRMTMEPAHITMVSPRIDLNP